MALYPAWNAQAGYFYIRPVKGIFRAFQAVLFHALPLARKFTIRAHKGNFWPCVLFFVLPALLVLHGYCMQYQAQDRVF
jgi:hypothetical protein